MEEDGKLLTAGTVVVHDEHTGTRKRMFNSDTVRGDSCIKAELVRVDSKLVVGVIEVAVIGGGVRDWGSIQWELRQKLAEANTNGVKLQLGHIRITPAFCSRSSGIAGMFNE